MHTTVGKLLLKEHLPDDLKSFVDHNILDKKGISSLVQKLAQKPVAEYTKAISALTNFGFNTATSQGSSVSLHDLLPMKDRDKLFDEYEKAADHIRKTYPKEKHEEHLGKLYDNFEKHFHKHLLDAGVAENKTLAKVVLSGARGSINQYRRTVAAQGVVGDPYGNRYYDMPIKRSFAEGLSPGEYFLHSMEEKKGSILGKISVADSGFFSKSLARAALPLRVEMHDCETHKGIPATTSNYDYVGSYLSHASGGYNRNNEITPSMLDSLRQKGVKEIIVRSPITCEASKKNHHASLCSMCVGKLGNGLAHTGSHIGLVASTTISEPSTQLTLGCLAGNTMVRMADNTVKPIRHVKEGDIVLGADKQGNTFPTKVTHFFDKGMQDCRVYLFGKRESLKLLVATADHKVLGIEGDILKVTPLGIEDNSFCAVAYEQNEPNLFLKRSKEEPILGKIHTYDIEVAHEDALFVLANGLIVSNSKHGLSKNNQASFEYINKLVNPPKDFPNEAHLAKHSGIVTQVHKLPQGGHEVHIGKTKYYVASGLDIRVKKGDHIDRGEQLSEGVINPKKVTETRGIGEGRLHWSNALHDAFKANGLHINKKIIDVLARANVDHVQSAGDDNFGDDEIISYQTAIKGYKPREDSKDILTSHSLGHYLESPVLHYTIGTPITKKVISTLKRHNINTIKVHERPPSFFPVHQRLLDVPAHEPDWMHQLYSTYLQKRLLSGVSSGATSSIKGPSPIAGIAYGKGFGDK